MPDIPRQLKLTADEILCPQHEFFPNSHESQDQLRFVLSWGSGKKKASGQGGRTGRQRSDDLEREER